MAEKDCPSCHYPAPQRKSPKDNANAPQSLYHTPEVPGQVEDCPQCFYQPEDGEKKPKD